MTSGAASRIATEARSYPAVTPACSGSADTPASCVGGNGAETTVHHTPPDTVRWHMSDTGTAPTRILARVAELWRYPVKSMAGESLQEAELAWHGIAGDRRWAFVRGDTPRSGFPWLTIRERPEMVHYRPYLRDPARPNRSEVWVRRPDGEEFDVIDPALAVGLSPGARPIKLDRGIFDVQPVSVLSRQSLDGLAALVGTPLDARRFRANIVLEAEGSFPEDEWVGRTLELGSARIRVDQRDERCVLINVDPVSGERDPSVLKTVGRERDACLGVYGATVRPGMIRVGDIVAVCG